MRKMKNVIKEKKRIVRKYENQIILGVAWDKRYYMIFFLPQFQYMVFIVYHNIISSEWFDGDLERCSPYYTVNRSVLYCFRTGPDTFISVNDDRIKIITIESKTMAIISHGMSSSLSSRHAEQYTHSTHMRPRLGGQWQIVRDIEARWYYDNTNIIIFLTKLYRRTHAIATAHIMPLG